LANHNADIIVCYLSEVNFFSDGLSVGFPLFFSFSDLPDFLRLGGRLEWNRQSVGYGLLGHALPTFQLRECVAQRFLGDGVARLHQRERDNALSMDFHDRAITAAGNYHAHTQSAFQMAAFEEFVARCRTRHRTVVLCCGQVNPVLASELNPALRPQMLSYLNSLAARYSNVVLLEESALPKQGPADYEDLTHVNNSAQIRFTESVGDALEKLVQAKRPFRAD